MTLSLMTKRSAILFALLCLSVLWTGCKDDIPHNDNPLTERHFLDEDGRVLILRGVNLSNVSKGPTGLPGTVEETKADAQHFEDLGFNVVRYLIQWKNIEPQQGQYDDDYLKDVRERLDILHAHGLYVILDMHQDVYGPKFNYNGAPEWATMDDDIPYVQDETTWAFNYLTPAVKRAFDNFWDYEKNPQLQDAYAAMWRHTAKTLLDHPAVIALDLMNEPHPGSDFNGADMLFEEQSKSVQSFDRDKLGPFYQRVINAIREVDQKHWILYEPRYGAPGDGKASFLPTMNDPRDGTSRLAQAPHMYVFSIEVSFKYSDLAGDQIEAWEEHRRDEMERDNTGMFLGEFGTYTHVERYDDYMNKVVEATENLGIGYSAWAWDPYEFGMIGERDPETHRAADGPFLDIISRPYPRAFAGVPTSFSFDPDTEHLEAKWTNDPDIQLPTEFFMARERWYKSGWAIKTSPEEGVQVDVLHQDTNQEIVNITVTDSSIKEVSVQFVAFQ